MTAFTSDAQAQTPQNSYGPAQCTGGTHTVQGAGGTSYTPTSGVPYGGGDSYNNACTVNCTGGITAKFTWNGPKPPPQQVSFLQSCVASWSGAGSTPPTGSCANGLGDPSVPAPPNPHGASAVSGENGSQPIYHYLSMTGAQTITLPVCDAQATATSVSGSGVSASVSYTAAVTPIILTINPGGQAIQDSSLNWDILVGQKCSPTMTVSPSGYSLSNYQWSVTGTTFQSWTVSADQSYTTEVDGPGPLNGPNTTSTPPIPGPSWYWNDASSTTETITCTATVTPPAGQGSAFTVTATQQVNVMRPTPSWGVDPVDVITSDGMGHTASTPTNAGFQDNSKTSASYGATTFWWPVKVTVPSPFSGGLGCFVQVVTPSSTITRTPTGTGAATYSIKILNAQGQWVVPGKGVDGGFPYGFGYTTDANGDIETQASNSQFNIPYGAAGDAPSAGEEAPDVDNGGTGWQSGTLNDQFTTWLMYKPPGGVWVPLQNATWSIVANASGGPGSWSATGTYSKPSPVDTSSFPSWTLLIPTSTNNKTYRP